jgi:hypothetical protein
VPRTALRNRLGHETGICNFCEHRASSGRRHHQYGRRRVRHPSSSRFSGNCAADDPGRSSARVTGRIQPEAHPSGKNRGARRQGYSTCSVQFTPKRHARDPKRSNRVTLSFKYPGITFRTPGDYIFRISSAGRVIGKAILEVAEDLDQAAQQFHLPNKRLRELAMKHKPPHEWC